MRGFEQRHPNYYVRLGSLSTRLRRGAYSKAVAKIQEARKRSQEFMAELNATVDLVGVRRFTQAAVLTDRHLQPRFF